MVLHYTLTLTVPSYIFCPLTSEYDYKEAVAEFNFKIKDTWVINHYYLHLLNQKSFLLFQNFWMIQNIHSYDSYFTYLKFYYNLWEFLELNNYHLTFKCINAWNAELIRSDTVQKFIQANINI